MQAKIKNAFSYATAEALRNEFRAWCSKWPGTTRWGKQKSVKVEWWDVAADVCRRHEISPALLIYLVHAYGNSRAEDAEIPFSATSFRSESLLSRTVANYRWAVNHTMRYLEPIYILRHQKSFEAPSSTVGLTRLVADLVLEYFKTTVEIMSFPYKKATGQELSPESHDLLCYQLCGQNPFLLLAVAKTPRIRALAATNVFFQNDMHPWHADAWQGLVTEAPFCDLQGMAGGAVNEYYAEHKPVYCWPMSLADHRPFAALCDEPPGIIFHLLQFPLSGKTDMFLTTKVNMARNGLPNLSDPWR
jgi:hypothetical protein